MIHDTYEVHQRTDLENTNFFMSNCNVCFDFSIFTKKIDFNDLPIRIVEIVDSEISLVFSSDRSIGLDFCDFLAFLLAAIFS